MTLTLGTTYAFAKQIHTTGEDRFSGALAILKMVDPERAEQIRNAAMQKRKKEISYES